MKKSKNQKAILRKKNCWKANDYKQNETQETTELLSKSQISVTNSIQYEKNTGLKMRNTVKNQTQYSNNKVFMNTLVPIQLPFYVNPHPNHIQLDFSKNQIYRPSNLHGNLKFYKPTFEPNFLSLQKQNDSSKRQSEFKKMNSIVENQINQILESTEEKTREIGQNILTDSDLRESLAIFEKKDLSKVPDLSFAVEEKFNCSKSSIMKNETILMFEDSERKNNNKIQPDLIDIEMNKFDSDSESIYIQIQCNSKISVLESQKSLDKEIKVGLEQNFEIKTVNNFDYQYKKNNLGECDPQNQIKDLEISDLIMDSNFSGISVTVDPQKMEQMVQQQLQVQNNKIKENYNSLTRNRISKITEQNYLSNPDNYGQRENKNVSKKTDFISKKKRRKNIKRTRSHFPNENYNLIKRVPKIDFTLEGNSCSVDLVSKNNKKSKPLRPIHQRALTFNLQSPDFINLSKFEQKRKIYKSQKRNQMMLRKKNNIFSPVETKKTKLKPNSKRRPKKFGRISPRLNNNYGLYQNKISTKFKNISNKFGKIRYSRAISDPQQYRSSTFNTKKLKIKRKDLSRVNKKFSISSVIKKMDLVSYKLDQQLRKIDNLRYKSNRLPSHNKKTKHCKNKNNSVFRKFSRLRKNSLKSTYANSKYK